MRIFVLFAGGTLLIFSFLWGYLWLEVLRDPKNELADFYKKRPLLNKTIATLNMSWLPISILGAGLIGASLFIPE